MSQRLLAIESATDWLSIALFEDGAPRLVRRADGTRQHAAALMPMIAAGLAELGWSVAQLDALGLSTGPGSFTSLRIGLATAKGLAFGRDWRGVGVSTLEAMALAASTQGARVGDVVLAVLDARRGEWYAGGWRLGPAGAYAPALEPVLAEGLYGPEGLAADLGSATGPPVVICPERTGWRAALDDAGVPTGRAIEGEAARPDAEHVGRLALQALASGASEPVDSLTARYLRRAEAEEATRSAGRGGGRGTGGARARVNRGLAGDPAKRRVISRS
jgi:tRNA threonylcarbamoyladenosine biosynthesis protein TsaB